MHPSSPSNPSTLSHAEILHTYGISRNKIRAAMMNRFALSSNITAALNINSVACMSGVEFFSQVYDGQYPYLSLDFNIIYQFCTPAVAKKAPKLIISFRAAWPELNLEPICIVQIADSGLTSHGVSNE